MLTLDLDGLDALIQQWTRLAQQAPRALAEAMQAEADRILDDSYPLVPHLTGDLVRSGTVLDQDDGAEIRYGFFGAVPYAAVQHENTEYHHPGGGEHHFLSKPVFEATDTMAARLAAELLTTLRP